MSNDSTIHEILRVLGVWLKGQFIIWISETGMLLVGFAIARTPLWPVLAILCGLASVIPHFGPLFGLILVLFFSFFGSDGETSVMLAALAVWLLVQIIEGFFIGPRFLGRRLGLSPWIVLLGGIAGAVIAGPIGMLVATPLLAIGAVIWRRTRHRRSAQKPVKY